MLCEGIYKRHTRISQVRTTPSSEEQSTICELLFYKKTWNFFEKRWVELNEIFKKKKKKIKKAPDQMWDNFSS